MLGGSLPQGNLMGSELTKKMLWCTQRWIN